MAEYNGKAMTLNMKKRILSALLVLLMTAPAGFAQGGGEALGFELLKRTYLEAGGALLSPYSLAQALNMAAAGAMGDTKSVLISALGEGGKKTETPEGVTSANAAFVSDQIQLTDAYQKALEAFDARIFPLTSSVASDVNAWVSEHTKGRIPELLTDAPDPLLRLMLLNAVTLDAQWKQPFGKSETYDEVFHGETSEAKIPFLHREGRMEYARYEGADVVRLPYKEENLACWVLIPDKGGMETLLDALCLHGLNVDFSLETVRFSMPKLDLTGGGDLTQALKGLGLEVAFSDDADFSGMTGMPDLYIDKVIQKVTLTVDEDGTKAAAATAAMMNAKSAMPMTPPRVVSADRPYVLLVRDDASDTTFFAACVTDF